MDRTLCRFPAHVGWTGSLSWTNSPHSRTVTSSCRVDGRSVGFRPFVWSTDPWHCLSHLKSAISCKDAEKEQSCILQERFQGFMPILSRWSGAVVGLTLVAIGCMGIYESRFAHHHEHTHESAPSTDPKGPLLPQLSTTRLTTVCMHQSNREHRQTWARNVCRGFGLRSSAGLPFCRFASFGIALRLGNALLRRDLRHRDGLRHGRLHFCYRFVSAPIDLFDSRLVCRDGIECCDATSTVDHDTSLHPCCICCPHHWTDHSPPQPRLSITFLTVVIGEHLLNRTRAIKRHHSAHTDSVSRIGPTPCLSPLLAWQRVHEETASVVRVNVRDR